MEDFCETRNITQRELVIIAIVEALTKYGYAPEVKGILH